MKRFLTFIIASIIIVSLAFGIMKNKNSYTLDILRNDLELKINVKGLNNLRSFDMNENGDLYLASEDTIKIIDSEGATKCIIKENSLNIHDLVYFNGNLYIATDNRIVKLDLKDNNFTTLIENLPNKGLNNKINILERDGKILFEIGSNTNDGIVNEKGQAEEVPTVSWTLTGENFGEGYTGIFSPYSISTEKGEKVKGEGVGNAAIYEINLENLETKLISHGIRSINGWDVNSENKIIAIVNGITDETVRKIKNDKDYIYLIEDNMWYGWPDYSGGDPITSPRFTDNMPHKFLIQNHIDKNPNGPLYQYDKVNSLKALAVDEDGRYLEKDSAIFSDEQSKMIYALNNKGNIKGLIKLSEGSNIEKILINEKGIYILDSGEGALYEVEKIESLSGFKLPYEVWIIIIVLLLSVTLVVLIKKKKGKRL